jgi:hypothetical protein
MVPTIRPELPWENNGAQSNNEAKIKLRSRLAFLNSRSTLGLLFIVTTP